MSVSHENVCFRDCLDVNCGANANEQDKVSKRKRRKKDGKRGRKRENDCNSVKPQFPV
jgi:hypothetical protein